MISQIIPSVDGRAGAAHATGSKALLSGADSTGEIPVEQGVIGRNGSVRRELHVAPRRKGTRLDPSLLPRGVGARWLRRTLLLSGTGPAGGGRRRQCAARRDRDVDHELS